MENLENRINIALNEIRPFLLNDGGDIELVSIDKTTVQVRLIGNCSVCSISQTTLKLGVENTIKKHAPEIENVINID